jgi:hypothetical protein
MVGITSNNHNNKTAVAAHSCLHEPWPHVLNICMDCMQRSPYFDLVGTVNVPNEEDYFLKEAEEGGDLVWLDDLPIDSIVGFRKCLTSQPAHCVGSKMARREMKERPTL